jgi:segregation and condensation protein A
MLLDRLKVKLDAFEGPLDLLLHLVKKNEVEVTSIPITTITDQYLAYLDLLHELNLDIAGEYLVMAATLLHIKSRMLLPGEEQEEEEGEDPRAQLVQQLLEYQRYREAAEELARREMLERDVFARPPTAEEGEDREEILLNVSLGDLLDALQEVLKQTAMDATHAVVLEEVSLTECLCAVVDKLRVAGEMVFSDLFSQHTSRLRILVTFLALLELVRTRMVRVQQEELFAPICISLAVPAEEVALPEGL